MNERLNLIKILKKCPVGTKLYSPVIGDCELVEVKSMVICTVSNAIKVRTRGDDFWFTCEGKFLADDHGECLLFPSKENRDWSTFKVPKKEYDFKPFDKVLVRGAGIWTIDFYSHFNNSSDDFTRGHVTISGIWENCIPYEGNEHLLGTSNPE